VTFQPSIFGSTIEMSEYAKLRFSGETHQLLTWDVGLLFVTWDVGLLFVNR